MIGTTLAHYRVTAALGAGGMGEVWRAEDEKLGRQVALKVLPADVAEDPDRLARFEREAKVLASLNHPNIAMLFGLETVQPCHSERAKRVEESPEAQSAAERIASSRASGGPSTPASSDDASAQGDIRSFTFLVMELVEGEDLSERIARGAIPIDEAIPIALQIAEALEAAHEAGIVHRDLKPANIKLRPDGTVKVLDFGLAKAWETDHGDSSLSLSPTMTQHATIEGVILGTAAYMSPEQARGKKVDRRADIWAFGVVLWEMLTGRKLFEGETVSDVLAAVLRAEPDLSMAPSTTPRSVRVVLSRCLERDPRTRLQWIGEARIALGASDSASDQSSVPDRGGRPIRKWAWAVGAVLALLIAAVFGSQVLAPNPPPTPLRKLELASLGVESHWFTAPALSPDGSKVAFSSKGAIWVRDLEGLVERQVAEISKLSPMVWSPDSSSLAYADRKKLWRVDVEGGRSIVLCDLPGTGSAIGIAWRDDDLIAFASWRGAMYSVQATGGPPAVLFDNEPGIEIDFHDPTWLPDGRLLFAAHRDLSEPEASGDGSRDAGGDDLEIMEIGLFDGDRREVVDLGMSGNLKFLVYDHLSEHLVYTRNNPSPGVWVIPVERGDLSPAGGEFLIAPNGWTVSLDDGGSMLYVEGAMTQSSNELVKLDRSGRLTSVVAAALPGLAEPSVSPDARYIAVTAEGNESRDVWIVDLERGSDLRLTFDDVDATTPAWFPSSREIMYSEIKGMSSDIVSRSIDGSGRRTELVPGTGYGLWSGLAQMSPDGRLLVYAIDVDGPTYLHVSDIGDDGSLSDARPLFSLEENPSVLDARVSPSGELLAYMTTDSGQPEVFLTRFPSGEGRWQVSKDGGRMPRWSSESGELFFVSGSGPGQRMLTRVEIGSGPEVVLGEPIALFEIDESAGVASIGAGFDVLPDGVEFIFVRREGGSGSPSQRLILVQNWIREFGAAE